MPKKLITFVLLFFVLNTVQARYETSDSGTSMTLAKADKNAEDAENKSRLMTVVYFSPLVVILIAMAAKRRRKKLTI
ncbi:MAG TPA: hypothetical protein VD905_09810 [Flavobacteriales bacterium]|nr:hypothetical protein [Flavobacteriales bacterium]